jgi:hypothetical protein
MHTFQRETEDHLLRLPLEVMAAALLLAMGLWSGTAGGQDRLKWQSNLDTTPDGIVMGIRDKMGDMTRNYRVFFQVVAPDEREYTREYTLYRMVQAHQDEFVEVVFPGDFNAPPTALKPGRHVCT